MLTYLEALITNMIVKIDSSSIVMVESMEIVALPIYLSR